MWGFLKNGHYAWDTGLPGHITYGPLGKPIKNNVEAFLRREFRFFDFQEIETPLIFRREVWQQSGHWDRFQDPIVRSQNGKCYRVDKLIEEHFPDAPEYSTLPLSQIKDFLRQISDKLNPVDAKDPLLIPDDQQPIEQHSLMMRTQSGYETTGLRPETATATYFHYQQLQGSHHHQWPIKVFQIGKSFRNEINPKHGLIRGREFTQAEFQVILPEEMKQESLQLDHEKDTIQVNVVDQTDPMPAKQLLEENSDNLYYFSLIVLTYKAFLDLGLPPENLRLRRHGPDEMAFYALDAYDLEVKLKNLGWTEIAGIHDRGGYDLRHLNDVNDNEDTNTPSPPHILEVAIGIDRLVHAILDNLYEEKQASEGKSMLKLPYFLAPIQVSVLPLMKNKPPLVAAARKIYYMLKRRFITEYADKKSVGKRYLANAQRGIPYSITIDYQTLEDQTVTVRDRDTEEQIRVPVQELTAHLYQRLAA